MRALIEDSRQQRGKHEHKLKAWEEHGIEVYRCALPCGDYALPPAVAVDTKAGLAEIAGNIGGSTEEHERFRRELIRARDMGTHLYILVENTENVRCLMDVMRWVNPRLLESPKAITGERLAKAMRTMEIRYGCNFVFCRPEEAACMIFNILERGI